MSSKENVEESRSDQQRKLKQKSIKAAGASLRERIIVALDFASVEEARRSVQQLKGHASYLKLGMELYYLAGPAFIYELKEQGFKLFLDLKLHDIPNTVKGASRSLARLEVDMYNVHCAGGVKMMEAAREGMEQGLSAGQAKPSLIGVTVLTSTDQAMMNNELKIMGSLENYVLYLASLSKQAGLDGVVCSPFEVPRIKKEIGDGFLAVTPGIRPSGTDANDQRRFTTPAEAVHLGADFMVIGRAITQAGDQGEAFEQIVRTITHDIPPRKTDL